MQRIFVYGTLKLGYRNHYLLGHAVCEGSARTKCAYRMWDTGFPLIKLFDTSKLDASPFAGQVQGEVYVVDLETIAALDRLEDEGKMYLRVATPLVDDDGRDIASAMVYEWIGRPSGDMRFPVNGVLNWKPALLRQRSIAGLQVAA